ncbi:MAG: cyclic nucleotide-binding domain-containing protein [Candidatus Delongbacteria bacterium]|nr:cyclic nucleotide-binding domain-containing protein [Candidatus Delongbacteria bacterium]
MLSEKILEYLSRSLLFEGISSDELQKLDPSFFEIREYQKDDLIIEQNADPDGIYLILKGSVVIKKTTMKEKTEDKENKEIILNYCAKNEFVGELALVSNKKRAANVYCFSSICKIIFINTENFYKVYEIIPAIQKNLGKTIAERLGETSIRAANESSKYKKLYELQLENSMRTTELLKAQKEFEKRNQELLQNQREIKRSAIVETIMTMINTVHHDFENLIYKAGDHLARLEKNTGETASEDVKNGLSDLSETLNALHDKLKLYSDSATLEFGYDKNGKKVIVFKKNEEKKN